MVNTSSDAFHRALSPSPFGDGGASSQYGCLASFLRLCSLAWVTVDMLQNIDSSSLTASESTRGLLGSG